MSIAEKVNEADIGKEYDVCIAGSGPAGLALCDELADSGLRVCVVESGYVAKTDFADKLRRVTCDRIQIQSDSQERLFGGTSETWAGLCAPLDHVDFLPRSSKVHSGWPISRGDLDPYYERAALRYGFPSLRAFEPDRTSILEKSDVPAFLWRQCEEKLFLKPSPIYRFGTEGLKVVRSSPNVRVITGATVTRLEAALDSGDLMSRVDSVVCKSVSGAEFRVRAHRYVLAVGAIEGARILLNSTNLASTGLGNEHDQVGRYLMNHPRGMAGRVVVGRPIPPLDWYGWRSYSDGIGYFAIRLKEDIQKEQDLLNCCVRIFPHYPWTNKREPEALRAILAELRAFHFIRKGSGIKNRVELAKRFWADATSIWPRIGSLCRAIVRATLFLPVVLWLSIVKALKGPNAKINALGFVNYLEMEPNPENRVTLGSERDALGARIPHVSHGPSPRDIRSLEALHLAIKNELELLGYGPILECSTAKLSEVVVEDACHYMGTARMGNDPRTSVVNSDLRVHSVSNLYVSGGAVFPSSGCANPTMTIVALSLRLGDHLKGLS